MPGACAGVTAVAVDALTTLTLVAAVPPKLPDSPAAKPVPVIVTICPPALELEAGLMPATAHVGWLKTSRWLSQYVAGMLLAVEPPRCPTQLFSPGSGSPLA